MKDKDNLEIGDFLTAHAPDVVPGMATLVTGAFMPPHGSSDGVSHDIELRAIVQVLKYDGYYSVHFAGRPVRRVETVEVHSEGDDTTTVYKVNYGAKYRLFSTMESAVLYIVYNQLIGRGS
jgi:hypothetical protein